MSIIVLYGTSTSGKTTICSHLKLLCENLNIEGTDSTFKMQEALEGKALIQAIEHNKKMSPLLHEVQKRYSSEEICRAINSEVVLLEDHIMSLMFDSKDNSFNRVLVDRLKQAYGKVSIDVQHAIYNLRKLAQEFLGQNFILRHQAMFDRAVEMSNRGIPSVLDIIPHPAYPGQFMIDLFKNQLNICGYSSSTHIGLIHCPLYLMSERMTERNKQALMSENTANMRDGSFPFRQYSQLFGLVKDSNSQELGTLNEDSAKRAISPFCNNPDEFERIIGDIGFLKGIDEITISAKCDSDKIYDASTHSSKEIAKIIYNDHLDRKSVLK